MKKTFFCPLVLIVAAVFSLAGCDVIVTLKTPEVRFYNGNSSTYVIKLERSDNTIITTIDTLYHDKTSNTIKLDAGTVLIYLKPLYSLSWSGPVTKYLSYGDNKTFTIDQWGVLQ